MSESGSFYDKNYVTSIEQAVLAEDVKFSTVANIEGKFFIKVLTPMVDSTKLTTRTKAGITSSNYITLTIPAYMLLQFMNLEVTTIKVGTTSKNVLSWEKPTKSNQFIIPKGTIFFVEFLGGLVDADKCYIVGISQFSLIQD